MRHQIKELERKIEESITHDVFNVYEDVHAKVRESRARVLAGLCEALYWLRKAEREEIAK